MKLKINTNIKVKLTQLQTIYRSKLGRLGEIAIAVKQEMACKAAKFFEMGNGIEFLNEKFTQLALKKAEKEIRALPDIIYLSSFFNGVAETVVGQLVSCGVVIIFQGLFNLLYSEGC